MDQIKESDKTEVDRFEEVFNLQYIPPEIYERTRKSILRGSITWAHKELQDLPRDVIREELARLIAKEAAARKKLPYDIVRVDQQYHYEADTESAMLCFTSDELKEFAKDVFQNGMDFMEMHQREKFQDRMQRLKFAKKEVDKLDESDGVKSKFKEILDTYYG